MRFVLYVSRLPRNLLLLIVERVFVSANGLVCDAPEVRIAYKTRFAGFMRLSGKQNEPTALEPDQTVNPRQTELAKRRHEAIRAQMLHGGMR
ncbi:hypothetical protein BH10CYA1_BH10CYA1_22760 [soil metagenome]